MVVQSALFPPEGFRQRLIFLFHFPATKNVQCTSRKKLVANILCSTGCTDSTVLTKVKMVDKFSFFSI